VLVERAIIEEITGAGVTNLQEALTSRLKHPKSSLLSKGSKPPKPAQ
jgi:hypothetical protein